MSGEFERVQAAAAYVKTRISEAPDIAITLGSGLGGFASRVEQAAVVPYGEIPGWPPAGVVGHAGRLVAGRVRGRRVVVLSGRSHFYEGHPMATVVFGTRVVASLGARTLILTNAAGGINTSFSQGGLMVIDDHLNLMGTNPLVGPNDDRFGPRFPDMSEVYSRRLRIVADRAAERIGLALSHGVYVGLHGPSYETPAEIRYLRSIGGDAVGMSTVAEAIAARHMGVEVLGISCITNMAAGVLPAPLDHSEVMATGQRVRGAFIALIEEIVAAA
ncbi:MAG TPA: purine-nucleoside phosphorylase [Vicinamibacterales bacterium]|nr:purine-nucleoside phosphorylase [Vicinamibacterales bacterium]HPW21974.1 purine-nucleoside phosphorylase [Vicinamibacterales bacterium]